MSVRALYPDYQGEVRDREENFHGMRVLYVGWDHHLMFATLAFMLPPDTPFAKLTREILPGAFGEHPDWSQVAVDQIRWLRNGEPFTPDPAASLDANGIDHKTVLRMQTPGLEGIKGSRS
ncbi:phenol hydroxylase subunit P4 [Thauera sp. 63]|uniref:phenol hydroxylase subunit P4 n=1 Tax=Thauera sp. 63 TaxID=497321 RepID=UPI0002D12013|nr:phenol hydroxylase subunit P4 [Thauera sp. 63]ENO79117.1 phenol hydrolase gammma subunit [Thauera sp. 63]